MDRKNIFNLVSDIEGAQHLLEETQDVIELLHRGIEDGGYQREDNFDLPTAILFVKQEVPMYLSLLDMIQRDFSDNLATIQKAVKDLYAVINEDA